MLTLLAKHGAFDLKVDAKGDLHVDQHHTVEDVGICFGQAVKQALGDKAGIRRYGHFTLPMEETLVTTAHRSERPILPGVSSRVSHARRSATSTASWSKTSGKPSAANALCNLHVLLHHGRNSHHISEAIFKCHRPRAADGRRDRSAHAGRAEHEGDADRVSFSRSRLAGPRNRLRNLGHRGARFQRANVVSTVGLSPASSATIDSESATPGESVPWHLLPLASRACVAFCGL